MGFIADNVRVLLNTENSLPLFFKGNFGRFLKSAISYANVYAITKSVMNETTNNECWLCINKAFTLEIYLKRVSSFFNFY